MIAPTSQLGESEMSSAVEARLCERRTDLIAEKRISAATSTAATGTRLFGRNTVRIATQAR
jgi:hypothetical protein